MIDFEVPGCCKHFMELKAVTEIEARSSFMYTFCFQCHKCGKVRTIVK